LFSEFLFAEMPSAVVNEYLMKPRDLGAFQIAVRLLLTMSAAPVYD
jgi:hypothetical protein